MSDERNPGSGARGRSSLIVNGKRYAVSAPSGTSLATALREELGLTGTKVGCGIGRCGSCTVLVGGKPKRSCRLSWDRPQEEEVVTVEGLAPNGDLHPLQKALIDHGAVQCGFCIPGILMSALGLLLRNPQPSKEQIIQAISQNLCRCTGYWQIVEAIEAAVREHPPGAPWLQVGAGERL